MKKPMIQIALDTLTIAEAISAAKAVEEYIDVIEVGTILLAACGKESIAQLKATFPNKLIVADMKIADAGAIFGKMAFDNKADLVTCICAAEAATVRSVVEIAQNYAHHPEVQIELTSHFTYRCLKEAWESGATHVVYHRSRDAQAAGVMFTEADLKTLKEIADMGFLVSVTGGIDVKDIAFFKGLPITIFIAGRTLRGVNAQAQAKAMREEIDKWF